MDDHRWGVIDVTKRTVVKHYRQLVAVKDPYLCVYCGEPAECIDHVVPVRYSNWQSELTGFERRWLVTVPACRECNNLAQAKTFQSFGAKREHIRTALEKKYHRVLNLPVWRDDEIEELSGRLRDYVAAEQARKALIRERLAYRGLRAI